LKIKNYYNISEEFSFFINNFVFEKNTFGNFHHLKKIKNCVEVANVFFKSKGYSFSCNLTHKTETGIAKCKKKNYL